MADTPTVRPLPPTTVPVLDNNQFTLPWRLWLQNLGLNTADITALEAQIVAAQAAASAAQITANDALTIAEEALAAAGNTTIGPAGPPGPLVWMGQDEGGEDGWVIPGPAGANGVIGRDGQNGVPGLDGVDGEDAWPIPGPQGPQGNPGAGGGAFSKVTRITGAGTATFSNLFTSNNTYQIRGYITFGSSGQIGIQIGTGAGPTYQTTNYGYGYSRLIGAGSGSSTTASGVIMNASAGGTQNFIINIQDDPTVASGFPTFSGFWQDGGTYWGGYYQVVTAFTGVRVIAISGSIAAYDLTLYAIQR